MPTAALGIVLGVAGLAVVAKAAYVQVLHSDAVMGEGTLVVQADGARRYQYNPRFQFVMREIPMGSIYDRNGLPLATSDWDELEKHRAEYQATRHRYRPRLSRAPTAATIRSAA